MARKNRSPEEIEHRAKPRELLQASNVNSKDGIRNLFKEMIAEFTENGRFSINLTIGESDGKMGSRK